MNLLDYLTEIQFEMKIRKETIKDIRNIKILTHDPCLDFEIETNHYIYFPITKGKDFYIKSKPLNEDID